jgi:predicted ATPase/DNA-binding SARP family transcriptional activator
LPFGVGELQRFRVLGPIEVRAGNEPVALTGARQLKLLAFLVLNANRAVSADALIDAVWGPEREGAVKRLQMAIARLRKTLTALEANEESVLRTVSGGYVLSVGPGELDAEVFADRVRDGRRGLADGNPARASELLTEALGMWRGPALAEVAFEDFAQSEIRRLEELRLVALETRIDADLQLGRQAELIGELEALLSDQPTREHLAGQLMTALYRSGRQADALEVYQRTRAHLASELGLEPGPAIRALQDQILSHDSNLSEPDGSNRAIATEEMGDQSGRARQRLHGSNVPTPTTPLVGRTEELSRATELLAAPEVRLLTLWGPGGSGKTRLALEVAAAALTRYRDGVWLVPLAPIQDRALMVSELARVLGVAPVPREPLERTLVTALSERELLLVLDNFEHLLDASAVVAEILANASRVDVLSTSREPLRIRGEQRMRVPPLSPSDAAELFLARARAIRPELSIDQEDRAAIDRICERLDRLPLALELAAALVGVFAPRRLETRLVDGLTLPEGPRDLPERQRTLRATIGWSYRLLDLGERSLLAALSPFVGGVRLDSAESIWGDRAPDGLVSLAEKSLLGRREDHDGEPRFWMLETIREFALERVSREGRSAEAADRHAAHFLALTDEAERHLLGPEQCRWLDRLEDDQANLRSALGHLTEHAPDTAVRMAANLEWFWIIRGYLVEGRDWLDAALAAAAADCPQRVRALAAAGQVAVQLGDAAGAKPLLLEAHSLADGRLPRLAVLAQTHLGWAEEALGNLDTSTVWHERAVAAAREATDDWAVEIALTNYGVSLARTGNLDAAGPMFREALHVARQSGEPRGIALAASNMAEMAVNLGELDEADALSDEALAHAQEIGFRSIIPGALHTRLEILIQRGDLENATTQLQVAIGALLVPDMPEAAASLLAVAGIVAAMRGHALRAATLWGAADEVRARISTAESLTTVALRSSCEPAARAAVDDVTRWEAARAAGRAMSLPDVLALAAGDSH